MAKNLDYFFKASGYDTNKTNWFVDNNNLPAFDSFPRTFTIKLGELDKLGRCTPAYACLDGRKITSGAVIKFSADSISEGSGETVVRIIEEGLDTKLPLEDIKKRIMEETGINTTDPKNTASPYLNIKLDDYKKTARGKIDTIYPTGWIQEKYQGVITGLEEGSNPYLYQRTHLLRHAFTQLNSEPRNIITGTQWLNTVGMLLCENEVLDYLLDNRDKFVQYRVSPIFDGEDLLPYAVRMEALSEDKIVCFNRVIPNTEPGITINYATGRSIVG